MNTTYPKATTVTIGYDPTEDRMFLILYLQDGSSRKAYISRRLLGRLLKTMGDKLTSTSPTACLQNPGLCRSNADGAYSCCSKQKAW